MGRNTNIIKDLACNKIIVYEAINIINGKRYIGITRRGLTIRRQRHFYTAMSGGGAVIGAAIRKYGKEAFSFRTLVVCPDFDYASSMEIALIALYKPEYNLTAGGGGVLAYKLSPEARAKISAANKGVVRRVGFKHPPEVIEKIRLSKIGKPRKQLRPYNLNADQIEAKRLNMLKNHALGLIRWTDEAKAKVSIGLKGNTNATRRAVKCLTTGEIFPSVSGAGRSLGIDRKSIEKACTGVYRATHGLKFCYYGETVANSQMERHGPDLRYV